MVKKLMFLFLVSWVVLNVSIAKASDDSDVILKLLVKKGVLTQAEVDDMRREVAAEKAKMAEVSKASGDMKMAEGPKTLQDKVDDIQKDLLSKVGLDKLSSRLKLKGRFAAGFFDSQKGGSFNNGSFQVPETKIQFSFLPDDVNVVVMRLNLNNATFNNIDYLYLDTNIMKLTPWEKKPFTLSSRVGEFKVDLGEETYSNNSVEGILPSNSAANVSGNDEGLQFSGKIGKERPLGWSIAVMNGNSGTGADTNWLKAFNGKLYYNIIDPLYVSASYYNSGNLGTSSSAISIGGITTPPTRAVKWSRQIFEGDMRYDIKKGKTLNPPAYCDSLAFVRAAYGHFIDSASPVNNVASREGNYAYAESLFNVTKKLYVAGRASFLGLNGGNNTAAFNNITSNNYERYSLGFGYRLTKAVLLKTSYDFNVEHKTSGNEDPKDNLFSILIAAQF